MYTYVTFSNKSYIRIVYPHFHHLVNQILEKGFVPYQTQDMEKNVHKDCQVRRPNLNA